jgi:hypothetical protein
MLIELDYPIPLAVELEAAQTLLLVIDMENENAHPDGATRSGFGGGQDGREAPTTILVRNIDEPILGVRALEALGLVVASRKWLSPSRLSQSA